MNKFANTATAFALLAGLAAAPATLAGEGYAVAYTEAQISSTDGMRALHQQIRNTAEEYCPKYSDVRSFPRINACVADVVDDLVAKVNQPAFTAYVEEQSRRARPALLAGGKFE